MIREKLNALHLPKLMKMNDGTPVQTPDEWRIRRRESKVSPVFAPELSSPQSGGKSEF